MRRLDALASKLQELGFIIDTGEAPFFPAEDETDEGKIIHEDYEDAFIFWLVEDPDDEAGDNPFSGASLRGLPIGGRVDVAKQRKHEVMKRVAAAVPGMDCCESWQDVIL
jgi:hypothetical protein